MNVICCLLVIVLVVVQQQKVVGAPITSENVLGSDGSSVLMYTLIEQCDRPSPFSIPQSSHIISERNKEKDDSIDLATTARPNGCDYADRQRILRNLIALHGAAAAVLDQASQAAFDVFFMELNNLRTRLDEYLGQIDDPLGRLFDTVAYHLRNNVNFALDRIEGGFMRPNNAHITRAINLIRHYSWDSSFP
ncbi:hypothetical protein FGB62_180g01 [Gracilaria domingensis]|nr:hypothetical protein FGB62_180g01 [Gracilaria domingensis]